MPQKGIRISHPFTQFLIFLIFFFLHDGRDKLQRQPSLSVLTFSEAVVHRPRSAIVLRMDPITGVLCRTLFSSLKLSLFSL